MADETDEKHKEENCHQAAYNSESPQKTVCKRLLAHGYLLMLGRAVDQVIYDPPQRF